jgi:hypothetical protein
MAYNRGWPIRPADFDEEKRMTRDRRFPPARYQFATRAGLGFFAVSTFFIVSLGSFADKVRADDAGEHREKTVRVVDESGKPVVGATVVPWAIRTQRGAHGAWSANGLGGSEPPTLTTDADGKVTIRFPRFAQKHEKIAPKELTCRVTHPDFAETSYNKAIVTDDVLNDVATIVVKQGAQVEAEAFVGDRLLPMERVYALWSSPSQADRKDMKVNAQGRLQLPRLPAGKESVRLVCFPEDGPALLSDVQQLQLANGDRFDARFEMKPAIDVGGQLDEDVPRPVKNGRVVVAVIDGSDGGNALQWRAWAKINDDGSFKLAALPQGDLQVIALCDGYMAQSGAPPDFVSDNKRRASSLNRPQVFGITPEMHQITLRMTPTSDCLFRVLGPDGSPVAGAKCSFWPNVHWWSDGSQIYCSPLYSTFEWLTDPRRAMEERFRSDPLFSAETGPDGRAIVKNIPSTEKSFHITHKELEVPINESKDRSGSVDLSPGEQSEVTVTLQRRGRQFVGEESDGN